MPHCIQNEIQALIIFSSVWLLPTPSSQPHLTLSPLLSLHFCFCDFLSVPPGSIPLDFLGLSFKGHLLRDAFPDTLSRVGSSHPCPAFSSTVPFNRNTMQATRARHPLNFLVTTCFVLFCFGCAGSSLQCMGVSPAVEHGQALQHVGSVVVAHGLLFLGHAGLVAPWHVGS